VVSLSFSYNEAYLASLGGQDDNSLVIWDVASGDPICGTPAATDTAHTVKFFNTSDIKLVTGGNYHIRVWHFDLPNKKIRPTNANMGQSKRVTTNVLIDPTDTVAWCGTTTGDIMEVTLERALFQKSGPKKNFSMGITCSTLLPTGDILVGTGDGTIAKLSADRLQVKAQCQVLGEVTSLAQTQDGSHFFCGTTGASAAAATASPHGCR